MVATDPRCTIHGDSAGDPDPPLAHHLQHARQRQDAGGRLAGLAGWYVSQVLCRGVHPAIGARNQLSAKAAAKAVPVAASTSPVCAVETNAASNCDGARYTPVASKAWKRRA